jgi:hypothetical protein
VSTRVAPSSIGQTEVFRSGLLACPFVAADLIPAG